MRVSAVAIAFSCWLLTSSSIVGGILLPEFFPFGPNYGDYSLSNGDAESDRVMLEAPIPFYGVARNYVTVRQ